ncbi:MAG: hypothetical protein WEA58_03970 [Balneolaceae bacterium]
MTNKQPKISSLPSTDFHLHVINHPERMFVMFTHSKGKLFTPDWLIRLAMKWRYGGKISEMFSHCGMVFNEGRKAMFYHQTYPTFKRKEWGTRPYSIGLEITDPEAVAFAKEKCIELNEARRGYGVGQLLTFVFTIWFKWMNNPITKGKVCSEAVAACFPQWITTDKDNTDPYQAYIQLKPHAEKEYRVYQND